MHLKSLTLKGFKSFAKPTTFALEPGVTAIVGPNGSGKSNVVDALAWVMGEQGAKSLRGGKMEDVIFAGTATRGPLGRAEVQLTIDNADGALPIEYSEVSIRRTLFRNGQSEYAINGETCRLLDVQELLSDSGLGREMHVIVGQGRLDTVLRATPEERRGFIEEAAGILKHRRRKEKTLRKLEAMEQNLARLNDLAGELRRQLKPLGRQAEVARQAQTIAADVRDAKSRLYADDVVRLRTELSDHARGEQERHTERVALEEQVSGVRARIAHLEREQTARAVDEAQKTLFALEQAQERIRGLSTLASQRLALLGSDDDADSHHVTVSQQAIDAAHEEVARLSDAVGEADDAVEAASRELARARAALDATDAEIAAQSARVSEYDMRITTLRGAWEAADQTLDAVRAGVVRQQAALDAANARRAETQVAFDELEAVEASEEEAARLQESYETAQAAVSAAERSLDEVRDAHRSAEREAERRARRHATHRLRGRGFDGRRRIRRRRDRGRTARERAAVRIPRAGGRRRDGAGRCARRARIRPDRARSGGLPRRAGRDPGSRDGRHARGRDRHAPHDPRRIRRRPVAPRAAGRARRCDGTPRRAAHEAGRLRRRAEGAAGGAAVGAGRAEGHSPGAARS
jgi:chromosome segregation protein